MLDKNVKIGGVYKLNHLESPIRVLASDEIETHYDSYWTHDNSWGFADLSKTCIFYRISTELFKLSGTFLRMEPLTSSEAKAYHPDLPLRLCRFPNLSWSSRIFDSYLEFKEELLSQKIKLNEVESLNISEIYLAPYGPKGAPKKTELIKAKDGVAFDGVELLCQASRLQSKHVRSKSNGVGIFRSGISHGIPAYFIGEYYDKAGIIKKDR